MSRTNIEQRAFEQGMKFAAKGGYTVADIEKAQLTLYGAVGARKRPIMEDVDQ